MSDMTDWKELPNDEVQYQKAFERALRTLINTNERRQLTLQSFKLVEQFTAIRPGDGLFLKAILKFTRRGTGFLNFRYAEYKGCTHPLLYWHLGNTHAEGEDYIPEDPKLAMKYYNKAIQGMCLMVSYTTCLCHTIHLTFHYYIMTFTSFPLTVLNIMHCLVYVLYTRGMFSRL